jgi:hypothetical protein
MATTQNQHTELNEVQVSLLRLFNRSMPQEEILELRDLIVNHYAMRLQKAISKDVEEKGYTQKDFDDMLNCEV